MAKFLLSGKWHGHDCHLNAGAKFNRVGNKPIKDLLEEMQKNSAYIDKQGFNLVECWECECWGLKLLGTHANSTHS